MKDKKIIFGCFAPATFAAVMIPSPFPNFSPLFAVLLICGMWSRTYKHLWVAAIGGYILAQLFQEFFSLWGTLTIVGTYLIFIGLGFLTKYGYRNAILAALIGGTIFFITTNFAVWLISDMYPHTWQGLTNCYTAALPFYRNTLAACVCYTVVFMFALKRISQSKAFIQEEEGL